LVNADTALTPIAPSPGASRADLLVGAAVCHAVQRLKTEIQAVAAEIVDCPPTDLVLVGDRVLSPAPPHRSVSLRGRQTFA